MNTFSRLVFPLLLIALSFQTNAADTEITDPSINATPPGSKVSAGYFTLHNKSDQSLSIIGAHSPKIARIELHLTRVVNDVTTMEKQLSVSVPAGQSVMFKPGSFHLMLMGLTEPLNAGDTIPVTIETSAGEIELAMPVTMPSMHSGKSGHSMQKSNANDHSDGKMQADMKMDKDTDVSTTGSEVIKDVK